MVRRRPAAVDRRPTDKVTLKAGEAFRAEQLRLIQALDAFGYRDQAAALGKTEQMAKKNEVARFARHLANKRTVDLDDLDRQGPEMPQRGMAGAEIVKRNAAPRLT